MNRLTFAIACYAVLLLQVGLRPWLDLGGVVPSFLLVLAVFVALSATATAALGGAIVLGVIADALSSPYPGFTPLGPLAAGYFVGVYAVLQVRGMLFRNSVLTLAVMTLLAGLFAELVAVVLVSLLS